MSTAPNSYPSYSIPLFAQLIHRLRHTNARYNLIAYQCRHAYHPTHHAKRHAYQAGLRIDTSKACPSSPISLSVSDTITGHQAKRKEADETGGIPQSTGGGLPEAGVPECLSPLDLEIGISLGAGGDRLFRGGVPGAPRLRTKPLPDDEYRTEETVSETSLGCTRYDAVGLGIIIPERRLKRKLRD